MFSDSSKIWTLAGRLCAGLLLFFAAGNAAAQLSNPFESVGSDRGILADETVSHGTPTKISNERPANEPSGAGHVTLGAINVDSNNQIPAQLLANSYERFIGESADDKMLKDLADVVSEAARQQGYIFASAEIPPQSIQIGVVTVKLDPGPIDEIRIIGSKSRKLRRILEKAKGRAARIDIVERQLLLAGDLPGIRVKNSSYLKEDGKGILMVQVAEKKSKGYAALDNFGPETLGPVRAKLKLDIPGVLFDGDVLTVQATSTVTQPDELTFVRLRYANVLGDGGTVVGFSASAGRTQSGGDFRIFDLQGRNRYVSVFANHALKRSNDFNVWLNAELAYLQVRQTQDNFLFQEDEIVTAGLNFAANKNIGFGRIFGGVGVTQGLGVLGANGQNDLLNSRFNGSGVFTKANIWANAILKFGNGFGARLAANGQIASRPLLSSQEIGVGGPYFGKGFDFSERFGDEGVLGLVELRKEFKDVTDWLDWLQLYGFVDGGYVTNIGPGFGSGTIISSGGGLRAHIGKVDLGLEAGVPLNADRFESGDRSPKLNVEVGVSF